MTKIWSDMTHDELHEYKDRISEFKEERACVANEISLLLLEWVELEVISGDTAPGDVERRARLRELFSGELFDMVMKNVNSDKSNSRV